MGKIMAPPCIGFVHRVLEEGRSLEPTIKYDICTNSTELPAINNCAPSENKAVVYSLENAVLANRLQLPEDRSAHELKVISLILPLTVYTYFHLPTINTQHIINNEIDFYCFTGIHEQDQGSLLHRGRASNSRRRIAKTNSRV